MKKIILVLTFLYNTECVVYPTVPSHLLACYNSGGPPLGAPRRLDVLLSLLKKLEQNSQFDLRLFSSSLLISLRLDGIEQSSNPVENEFVTPYSASSFQFHKYKLLMDLLLPTQNLLEVDESLSLTEKCLLHQILSSTVRQWERGDEAIVCPVTVEQRQNIINLGLNESRLISRCPIELGVIQTDWGTISPGIISAAIASALEAQRVLVTDILNADVFKADIAEPLISSAKDEWFSDIETLNNSVNTPPTNEVDISNIWVATLAGDLAEVVVNQGPRVGSATQKMVIGSNNRWNDTLLPRNYYLLTQNATFPDWQFTDAEILSGIDGLILATYVPSWVEQRRSLRLSQIIDMYYSNEGVSFDPSVRACNRQALFSNIFNRSQLLEETSRFAFVLYLRQGSVYIPVEEIDRITTSAVEVFTNYVPVILRNNHKECQVTHSKSKPVMDLIVATDGSWKGYDVEKFLSWIGGALEVDLQRSTLALLHGNTGDWIAPPSDNLTTVFSHIRNFTGEWPNRLTFTNILSTIIQHSQNQSVAEMAAKASVRPSTVVLVVSPGDRLSSNEVESARELMNTLRTTYFDVYFAYVAQDMTGFQNIINDYLDYSELFLTTESTSVQDVINTVNINLINGENIPARIIAVHCPFNGTEYSQDPYEDLVLMNEAKYYRIHTYYLMQQALITVQINNNRQGRLLVCTWRGADTSHNCQNINEGEISTFNLTTPCPSSEFCPPAQFSITALSNTNSCANNDCRFPHQVGYYLSHKGLRCLSLRGSSATVAPLQILYLTFFVTISLYLIQ